MKQTELSTTTQLLTKLGHTSFAVFLLDQTVFFGVLLTAVMSCDMRWLVYTMLGISVDQLQCIAMLHAESNPKFVSSGQVYLRYAVKADL